MVRTIRHGRTLRPHWESRIYIAAQHPRIPDHLRIRLRSGHRRLPGQSLAWFGLFGMGGPYVHTGSLGSTLRHNIRGFLIIFVFAFAAAIVGFLVSLLHGSDYSAWEDLTSTLGVSDLTS